MTGTDEDSVEFIFVKIEEAEFRTDLGHVGKRKQCVKQKAGGDKSAQPDHYIEDGPGVMRVTCPITARCFGAW